MTDHQKLIEELERKAQYGITSSDRGLATRAAQAIRSLEGEVFRLSQSQPCGDGDSAAAPEVVRPGGRD